MSKSVLAAVAIVLALVALAVGVGAPDRPAAPPSGDGAPSEADEGPPGALYGRVTTHAGATHEGWLRWGEGEEAFWGHYFNGVKDENPWAAHVPRERRGGGRAPLEVFGIEFRRGGGPDLDRPFMARFGDIARIESRGDGVRGVLRDGASYDPEVRVTLKSGAVVDLNRLDASDFDDGVRVWAPGRGTVALGAREIRTIEFGPAPPTPGPPDRLYGTVRTASGDFTGFLQWDREASLGRDALVGRTDDGERVAVRFEAVRSIARRPDGGALVTTRDGRAVGLGGTRQVGPGNRGVYVDDPRFGRVLVSWGAFERVDLAPASGSGPGYDDFPPGRPLSGTVTTRAGRRLGGRLVYDLDESETTETLDAPAGGVDYTVPFGLVRSIELPGPEAGAGERALVALWNGVELRLERAGDLGAGRAGVLVFPDGRGEPEYVPWVDVERVDLDRPPATPPAEEPASAS